ncbi:GNAT family N-acetyltransferase [Nitriliruptor alkaliphilus]|uniref:GNAT family N-acetyltransferase n=1 Tax=Nitriliruptor alkaliphilus TaxID=427918 RepID=UPI000696BF0F|nr:GNAT family N-acetyltransferase [Nitriliruptor alkaliphilus]
MSRYELRTIDEDNVHDVLAVAVATEQRRFVADVAVSLAEAYVDEAAWPRAIADGGRIVGFVMGGFRPEPPPWWDEGPLDAVWRLNIDAAYQGRGVGRFAVAEVAAEAGRRGASRLTVFYLDGTGGPGPFYDALGFVRDGQMLGDQVVAHLPLS